MESENFKEIAFYSGKNKTVQANGNEQLKTISLANRNVREKEQQDRNKMSYETHFYLNI